MTPDISKLKGLQAAPLLTNTLPRIHRALVLFVIFASAAAQAQVFSDPVDWKEADLPPPPVYDVTKLLTFDVARSSNLVFGVDPGSFSISKADSVVRYVMVASSPSGAKNVSYEGIRCATAEVRTYARAKQDGSWVTIEKSEWKSLYNPQLPKHSLRFARVGACDGAAPVSSVRELVRKLTIPITQTPG